LDDYPRYKAYILLCCILRRVCYLSYLHSFPTRRSSDLALVGVGRVGTARRGEEADEQADADTQNNGRGGVAVELQSGVAQKQIRSEEHTSELQSRFDLVCRLLLEKKITKAVETSQSETT